MRISTRNNIRDAVVAAATLLGAAFLLVLLTGCNVIMPQTRDMIDTTASNAQIFAAKLQAGPVTDDVNAPVPQYVADWIKAEALQWQYMSDLAHWRSPKAGE